MSLLERKQGGYIVSVLSSGLIISDKSIYFAHIQAGIDFTYDTKYTYPDKYYFPRYSPTRWPLAKS